MATSSAASAITPRVWNAKTHKSREQTTGCTADTQTTGACKNCYCSTQHLPLYIELIKVQGGPVNPDYLQLFGPPCRTKETNIGLRQIAAFHLHVKYLMHFTDYDSIWEKDTFCTISSVIHHWSKTIILQAARIWKQINLKTLNVDKQTLSKEEFSKRCRSSQTTQNSFRVSSRLAAYIKVCTNAVQTTIR